MSWFSKIRKNIKSGWDEVKEQYEDYQIDRKRRNPVDPYKQAREGKSFGYSSREEQEAAQPRIKEQNNRHRQFQKIKEKQDPWIDYGNGRGERASYKKTREQTRDYWNNKFQSEARADSSNYKYKYDSEGNVVGKKFIEPKVTKGQSQELASGYGMDGLGKDYSGLRYDAAIRQAKADNEFYKKQTSSNTSFTFNPETLSKTENILNSYQFKLKDITDDGWNSKASVEEKTRASILQAESEFSKLFENKEEFDAAYQSNAEFRNKIDTFKQMGGNINTIKQNIKPAVRLDSVLPQQNVQDLTTYLSIGKSAPEQKAFNSLIPEGQLAQEQIQKIANIPKEMMSIYMGTPEMVGIYNERVLQAKEKQRIIEEEERNAEKDLKRQAQLAKDKYKNIYEMESARIEQNRLNAKNYMTGMLAKLGALKTTGKAPEALANLDYKYQVQAQSIRTEYEYRKAETDMKLDKALDDLDVRLDKEILRIETSLTDDKEKIYREILKAKKASDKEIYRIKNQFAKTYRSQLDKYTKRAKAQSSRYIKSMSGIASRYDVGGVSNVLNISFEQWIKQRESAENGGMGMSYSKGTIESLRPVFEKEKQQAIYQGLSEDAKMVVDGDASWSSFSGSKYGRKVIAELRAAGYHKSDFDKGNNKKPSSKERLEDDGDLI